MKKSIFKKLGGLFLGLAMGLGVAVGVTTGNKASEVKAAADAYVNLGTASAESNKLIWSVDSGNVEVSLNKGSSTNDVYTTNKSFSTSNGSSVRWYVGNIFAFVPADGYKIVGVKIKNATSSSYYGGNYTASISWDGGTNAITNDTTNLNFTNASSAGSGVEVAIETKSTSGASAIYVTTSKQSRPQWMQVKYTAVGSAKTLNSIIKIEGSLSAFTTDSDWDLTQLTPKGTLSNATSTEVDISDYVTLSTSSKPGSAGSSTVSVTVTPNSGSVAAQSFNVPATVSEVTYTDTYNLAGKDIIIKTNNDRYIPSTIGTSSTSKPSSTDSKDSSAIFEFIIVGDNQYKLKLKNGTNAGKFLTTSSDTGSSSDIYVSSTEKVWTVETSGSNAYLKDSNSHYLAANGTTDFRMYANTSNGNPIITFISGVKHTVTISGGDASIYVGFTTTLSASCDQSDTITWSSSSNAIATVSNGVVTGVSAGNVTITATCDDGAKDTMDIQVKNDVETLKSIAVSGQTTTFTKGANFSFGGTVTGTYSHANGNPDTQKTISSGITYTIDGVSATTSTVLNSVGEHSVIVSAGGKSATAYTINVNYADVSSIELDFTESTLGNGGSSALPGVEILPENANQGYSWGDPEVDETEGTISYTFQNNTLTISDANTGAGTITFTATASGNSGKTASVVFTIEAKKIAKITAVTVGGTPSKATQYVGKDFDPSGLTFTPSWSEGEQYEVTITGADIEWDALVAGQAVTGTYTCADGDIPVSTNLVAVENDALASIAFATTTMSKKSYYVGEAWDVSGFTISGLMNSGDAATINQASVVYKINGTTNTTEPLDNQSVTVTATYGGLDPISTTVSGVTVTAVALDHLIINATKTAFTLGDEFSFAGTITGINNDGTSQAVSSSEVDFSGYDMFATGSQTVIAKLKTNNSVQGTYSITVSVASYTSEKETSGTATWTASNSASDPFYSKSATSSGSGTLNVGIFSFNFTHNGYNGWAGTSDGHRMGQSSTGNISFTGSTPSNVKITKITIKCGGNKSTSSGSATAKVGSEDLKTVAFTSSGNGNREFEFNKVSGDITMGITCNSYYRFLGITINYVTIESVSSQEKHVIKLNNLTYNGTASLYAGDTISASDFSFDALFDTGATVTGLTSGVLNTTTLVEGEHDYTITYTDDYGYSKSATISLTALEAPVLDHIEITGSYQTEFTRGSAFNHNGAIVTAYYSNGYDPVDVTNKVSWNSPTMSGTSGQTATTTATASYTEKGVTKEASYDITLNPIHTSTFTYSVEGVDGSNPTSIDVAPEQSYGVSFSNFNGDFNSVNVSSNNPLITWNAQDGELSIGSAEENATGKVTFSVDNASYEMNVNIIAKKMILIDETEEYPNMKFDGYIGDTFTIEGSLLNFVGQIVPTVSNSSNYEVVDSDIEDGYFMIEIKIVGACTNEELTLSAVDEGETVTSEAITINAVKDVIDSISVSCSKTTYVVGDEVSESIIKNSLTVSYERLSGKTGTLNSSEYSISEVPSTEKRGSYTITVTSNEDSATDTFVIDVVKPNGLVIVTSKEETIAPSTKVDSTVKELTYEDGYDTTGLSSGRLKAGSTISSGSAIETDVGLASIKVYMTLASSTATNSGAVYKFKIEGMKDGEVITSAVYIDSTGFSIPKPSNAAEYSITLNNIPAADGINGWKVTVTEKDTTHGNGNVDFTNIHIEYTEYVSVPGGTNTVYTKNAMSDTLYDFLLAANKAYESVCDSDGIVAPNSTNWNLLNSDEYKALSNNDKALLAAGLCGDGTFGADGVYLGGTTDSSDMVIEFLQKYDYVVAKYGNEYNYLNRSVASSARINPILALSNVDNSVWVISAVALVGLTAIGGYFFYRKRKEI